MLPPSRPIVCSVVRFFLVAVPLLTLSVSNVQFTSAAFQSKTEIPAFEAPDTTLGKFTAELNKAKKSDRIISFTPKSGGLEAEFIEGGGNGRNLLQAAANKVPGARGSGGSSSGGANWSSYTKGKQLSISAGFGQRYWNPTQDVVMIDDKQSFYLQLRDLGDSQAFVLVTAKKDKTISIQLMDQRGAQTFDFEQNKDGSVTCIEIGPDFQFADKAKSFDDFAALHPDYVNQRLNPIFKYVGVGEPPSRFHPFVQKYVLAQLQESDQEKLKAFKEILRPMDEGEFQEREEASKKIDEAFTEFETLIESAITDSTYSVETRARLKKVYQKNVDPFRRALLGLIIGGKLNSDVSYLSWLLSKVDIATAEDDAKALIEQIKSVVGDGLEEGSDSWSSKRWQAWAAKQVPQNTAGPNKLNISQLMQSEGILDDVSDATSSLCRMKIVDGSLVTDEEHWAKSLGGKTVKEVCDEVREFIKEKNLPESWFKPGSAQYPETTVQIPQIVFDRIASNQTVDAAFAQRMSVYNRYVMNTANRTFIGSQLNASLTCHVDTNPRMVIGQAANANQKPVVQDFLNLDLMEKTNARRQFMYRDNKKGDIICGVRFAELGASIRLVQQSKADANGNRCFLMTALGTEIMLKQAKDFATLRAENESVWNQYAPLFEKFGVVVSE